MVKISLLRFIFILALILSIYSVVLGSFNIGIGSAPYSIFNEQENGLSILRKSLVEEGYEIQTIISTLQMLKKINKTGTLAIIGPTVTFSLEDALSILEFIYRGGSVLIADDFYSANSLLGYISAIAGSFLSQFGENVTLKAFKLNTSGVLMDAKSYYKSPTNPVIRNFNDLFGILSGVDAVVTNFPSTISIEVTITYENGTTINVTAPLPSIISFMTTTQYSWIETNLKSAIEGTATPDPNEWGGIPFPVGFVMRLPTGGGLAIISDPDIFSNQLVSLELFDNLKFALQLIGWLCDLSQGSNLVIFDESHLSHLPSDPLFGLSIWYGVLGNLVYSWIIGPFLPIMIIVMMFSLLFGYVPRLKKMQIRLFSRVERSPEITWYRLRLKDYLTTMNYRRAVAVLLDYFSYLLSTKYSAQGETAIEMVQDVLNRRSDLLPYKDEVLALVTKMYSITFGEEKVDKATFLDIINGFKKIKELFEY